jgi:uncharacterized Zn-binding protein involved in type VI secretion
LTRPAAVQGDRITGTCALHQIPNPATGIPQPSPVPFPFSAPLLMGLATRVFIAGRPAAVVGSSGLNTPPHVGLHPADPFMVPALQQGQVMAGSTTVLIEGRPAAMSGAQVQICAGMPGQLIGTAVTVIIGS